MSEVNLLQHLFTPLQIGRMTLRNRIMLPPHGRVTGNPFGTEEECERFLAYWRTRAEDGVAWIDGLNCFLGNTVMIPGFEPWGLGATRDGVFRLPHFRERARRYADMCHAAGAVATGQIIMQGGLPHSPSGLLANYTYNQVPHVLDRDEIRWFVEEYAFSAGELQAAGLDGVELHANHEDLLELFISPATNKRDDEYGGDREGRLRFLKEILAAIRQKTGPDFCIGIRMNMDELYEGGYDVDKGIEIARSLEATGHVDYFHGVIGNNWGAPSYIQPHNYQAGQWASIAGLYRAALSVPVVYTGRVSSMHVAENIIAAGHADVVGIARAMFADGQMTSKGKAGRFDDIRPCIGTNDCLHRILVEGFRFGCSVNPRTGYEHEPMPAQVTSPKKVLVVGAGPAGMEAAALLAQRGHRVTVWERDAALGGQMQVAARAQENQAYHAFLNYQDRRLHQLGVEVCLNRSADADNVIAGGFNAVVVATGAAPRRPQIPGIDDPLVLEGRDVMMGRLQPGQRVVVLAMEDHMQPLTIAGYLTDKGCDVEVIYSTPSIAPLIGKYSIGAPLAKLSAAGAQVRVMERVVSIQPGELVIHNIYSGAERVITDFDNLVLACGGTADNGLYHALKDRVPELHLLGDAYAPRRISFATRQAYELAKLV